MTHVVVEVDPYESADPAIIAIVNDYDQAMRTACHRAFEYDFIENDFDEEGLDEMRAENPYWAERHTLEPAELLRLWNESHAGVVVLVVVEHFGPYNIEPPDGWDEPVRERLPLVEMQAVSDAVDAGQPWAVQP